MLLEQAVGVLNNDFLFNDSSVIFQGFRHRLRRKHMVLEVKLGNISEIYTLFKVLFRHGQRQTHFLIHINSFILFCACEDSHEHTLQSNITAISHTQVTTQHIPINPQTNSIRHVRSK